MTLSRYSWLFAGLAVTLTSIAVGSYRQISMDAMVVTDALDTTAWSSTPERAGIARAPVDFATLYAADAAWRRANARQYTLSELRIRGDGRRSPRQAMQDRVYDATRAGNRPRAIAELQRWTRAHPRDADALLWLARLLAEAGRSGESVTAYRRALALEDEGLR